MAITLSVEDFDQLRNLLARQDFWRTENSRWDFMTEVLAGSPRKEDLHRGLRLDGTPGGAASRVIEKLAVFGQDTPGRELLGVLINRLFGDVGDEDAGFLRGLFSHYSFETRPIVYEPRAAKWLGKDTPSRQAELISGENTLRHVRVLELLLDAARAVVRIEAPKWTGSGFMISNDLVMTNHHVIESQGQIGDCVFEFNFQLDRKGNAAPVTIARARSGGIFHTSDYDPAGARPDALDYTIVELDTPQASPELFVPLLLRPAAVYPNKDRVSIIQHPKGDYKKISMQNNFVVYADELILQYTTSTDEGSSGSPVLNDKAQVVGLHHAWSDKATGSSTELRYFRNEGILMRAVVADIRARAPEIISRLNLI